MNAPPDTRWVPRIPEVSPSPYGRSWFRLLGLTAGASEEQWEARGAEVLAREGPPARPELDLAWLPEVRQDGPLVLEALEQLRKPEVRLRERLFWFHQGTPVDTRALLALRDGRPEEAEDMWRQAWREGQRYRATAAHNLGILYHSRALSAPRGEGPAARDFERARRWWRHVIEGGRLTMLMLHGEPDQAKAERLADTVQRAALGQLHELLTPGLAARREEDSGATGFIPLLGGERVFVDDFGSERSQSLRGLMLSALEEAEEAVRRGDRPAYEEAMDRAREMCPSPADQVLVDETFARLARRLVCRNLKPVRVEPLVVSVSGLGTTLWGLDKVDVDTRSYETTLMFTMAHLPVLPLGRFRVAERADGTYDFLGRLPLDGYLLAHQLALVGLVLVLFWGAGNLSQLSTETVEQLRRLSGTASELPTTLTPEELEELRRSHAARLRKLAVLDAALAELQAERRRMREFVLPGLEERVKDDRRRSEGGQLVWGALQRQRELEREQKRFDAIPLKMRQILQLRQRIERMEQGP